MQLRGFVENAEEGVVVALFLEQGQPSHGSVEGMVNLAAGCLSSRAWHGGGLLPKVRAMSKENSCVPFAFQKDFGEGLARIRTGE